MNRISLHPIVLLLAASGVVLAQQSPSPVDPQNAPPSNSGWRRASDPPPATAAQDPSAQDPAAQDQIPQQEPQPAARDSYGQTQPSGNRPPAAQMPSPAYGIPTKVTVTPGTVVAMRINQKLADNKNSAGDTFSGSLVQPLVVNGILVAPRGAMVVGRVAEASKIKNVHRLGIEVTGITLADGAQASFHTQLISRQEPPMPWGHHEEGAITTATADGSAPPAGATIGVVATKGHNSVIYPETVLTFQTENTVTVNTGGSAGAFRYVSPDDYNRPASMNTHAARRPVYAYGVPYPYSYPYPGWGWGYPYPYWGPTIGFGIGFGGIWGGWHGGWRR